MFSRIVTPFTKPAMAEFALRVALWPVVHQICGMKTSDANILFIPGMGGSGPDHWQSRWASRLSTARMVEQSDWDKPRREPWVDEIVRAVNASERPVVLVAHSIGAHAVAHAASLAEPGKIKGAMLVAPPSEPSLRAIAAQIETPPDFAPVPREPLPFPSLLVASRNDPYSPYETAEDLSYAWGSKFLDAGEAGHINAESGHGPWPEGLMSFAGFLRGL
jgi:predicted alpha/beta hydrolase family esterase